MHTATRRDAVRLLFILDKGGMAVGRDAPAGTIRVIKAEKRLQALDFWVRNPDYLAHELIEKSEEDEELAPDLLRTAEDILAGDEPEVRRLSMLRHFFGAYEVVDTAMSTLATLGLARMTREYNQDRTKVARTDYWLTSAGAEKAAELAAIKPLDWYAERAALVSRVAGKRSGEALKKRQHQVATYHNARWGEFIAPIHQKVRARLHTLRNGR